MSFRFFLSERKNHRKRLVLRGARQVGKSTLVRHFSAGSLLEFALSKNAALCIRFDLNLPDIRKITHTARIDGGSIPVSYTLLPLPLYMVEELPRILDGLRKS